MQIYVNGEARHVDSNATIASLIEELGLDPRQLAVERNLELAPRRDHAVTRLAEGDRLEVVTLVGGG
jgi:sulfur carrier protein